MAAIRHEARGAAREPDGGMPGRTDLAFVDSEAAGLYEMGEVLCYYAKDPGIREPGESKTIC